MVVHVSPSRSMPHTVLRSPAAPMPMGSRLRDVGILGSVLIFGLLADDWIASVGLVMLFVGWRYLLREPGPPITAAVFSSQWLQVMAAILYAALTGRYITEMQTSDYRPMVLLGLGCVAVLFTGFYLAARFRRSRGFNELRERSLPWTTNQIAVIYIGTIALSGILQQLAWSTSGLTQVILVLSRTRYVFLFLLVTRLVRPRLQWPWIVAILIAELGLGFTGFFADFREPLVIAGIAILGAMDRRKAATWVIITSIGVLAIASAVIWTGIKPVIRKDYMATISTTDRLSAGLMATGSIFGTDGRAWKYQTDNMVARLWVVYYPALTLKRVPALLPHENGRILWAAIDNVLTPRLFFPEKPSLPSQSEEVRKYAGVWVAGRETNTSYAFGYVAESYVDFGVPIMFVPVMIYGLILGFAYRWLHTHIGYHDLRDGVIIVAFWATLGVYEASWVMMIGSALTILVVLGGGAVFLERMLRPVAGEKSIAGDRAAKSWASPSFQIGPRARAVPPARIGPEAGTRTTVERLPG